MSNYRMNTNYSLCKRFVIIGLFFALMFSVSGDMSAKNTNIYEEEPEASHQEELLIDAYYFYFNACASCDVGLELKLRRDTLLVLGDKKEEINLKMFNAFYETINEKLLQFYDRYGVLEEHRSAPILFIGNTYIQGGANIDARLKHEVNVAKQEQRISNSEVKPQTALAPASDTRARIGEYGTDSNIVYFYVPLCADCEDVVSFFDELDENYNVLYDGQLISSQVKITKFNISDSENLNMLRRYFYEFDVPEERQRVPILFIGDESLSGFEEIKRNLQQFILSGKGLFTPKFNGVTGDAANIDAELTKYDFAGVITAGLINGVNPCSISMLLFLFFTVASKGLTAIKIGLSFIIGRFVAYFLLGTLFFNLLLMLNTEVMRYIEWLFKSFLAIAIILLVVFNIRDYFAAKSEKYDKIKLQLPVALRRMNHKWIEFFMSVKNPRLLMIAGVILGIIISIGEFLCTGQIYLLTLVYIMRISPRFDAMTVLLFILYGLALIVPMILLLLIFHKGKEFFEVSEWVRKNFQYIKLLNAFVFLVFGIILFFVF